MARRPSRCVKRGGAGRNRHAAFDLHLGFWSPLSKVGGEQFYAGVGLRGTGGDAFGEAWLRRAAMLRAPRSYQPPVGPPGRQLSVENKQLLGAAQADDSSVQVQPPSGGEADVAMAANEAPRRRRSPDRHFHGELKPAPAVIAVHRDQHRRAHAVKVENRLVQGRRRNRFHLGWSARRKPAMSRAHRHRREETGRCRSGHHGAQRIVRNLRDSAANSPASCANCRWLTRQAGRSVTRAIRPAPFDDDGLQGFCAFLRSCFAAVSHAASPRPGPMAPMAATELRMAGGLIQRSRHERKTSPRSPAGLHERALRGTIERPDGIYWRCDADSGRECWSVSATLLEAVRNMESAGGSDFLSRGNPGRGRKRNRRYWTGSTPTPAEPGDSAPRIEEH